MLLGRLFSYPDTHRYRIGPNYLQLPINAPKAAVNSYNKDGAMRYRHNGNQPVYAPNSFGGPQADPNYTDLGWGVDGAEIVRAAYTPHSEDTDQVQATMQWEKVLDDGARERLVSNIVGHATNAVSPAVQERVIEYWTNVHQDLGSRVADGIKGKGSDANGTGFSNEQPGQVPVGSSASTGL
jgi:catalase